MKKLLTITLTLVLTISLISVSTFTVSAETTVIYKFTFENGGDTIMRHPDTLEPFGEIVEWPEGSGNHALKYEMNLSSAHQALGLCIWPLGIDRIIGAQGDLSTGENYELTLDIACEGGSESAYMYPYMLNNNAGKQVYFDKSLFIPMESFQTKTWTMTSMWSGVPKQGERNGLLFFRDDNTFSGTCTIYLDNVTLIKNGYWKDISPTSAIYYVDGTPAEEGIVKSGSINPDVVNFEYELIDEGTAARITKNISASGDVVIPSVIEGKPVTEIGDGAFSQSTINSVVIPDTVVSIGKDAFFGCSYLWKVSIEGDVTTIGTRAFNHCNRLSEINIPDSVISIGQDAFSGTTWLTRQPNGVVYAGKIAYQLKSDIPISVELEVGTKGIADYAFYDCVLLTDITIPSSVIHIGEYAFGSCSRLESVTVGGNNPIYHSAGNCVIETASKTLVAGCNNSTIPTDGSVSCIGKGAFSGCSFTSITIPVSVTRIADGAFYNCYRLGTIYYDGSRADRNNIMFGENNDDWVYQADKWIYLGEPSIEPSKEPTEPPAILGDVDGDGGVSMKDVLLIRKAIAGMSDNLNQFAADVDGDGNLSMKDVLLIRKYIAGVIHSFDEPGANVTNPTQTTKTTQPTQPTQPTLHLLADDQYATIWYSGCEKEENIYFGDETNICFVVQNKTDYQLAFGVDSLAINGWTLTDIIEYENVAPNSKAVIIVSTEQLKNLDVKTISGVLVMWDVSFELWGDVSRSYPVKATIA